jgi:hypothetical protein
MRKQTRVKGEVKGGDSADNNTRVCRREAFSRERTKLIRVNILTWKLSELAYYKQIGNIAIAPLQKLLVIIGR